MENWIVIFYRVSDGFFTDEATTFVVKNTEYRDCCGWAKQETLNSKGDHFGKKVLVVPTSVLKAPENQIAGFEVSYKAI